MEISMIGYVVLPLLILGGFVILGYVLIKKLRARDQNLIRVITEQLSNQIDAGLSSNRTEITTLFSSETAKTAERLGKLTENLKNFQESSTDLSDQVGGLRRIFDKPKEAGLFGEIQLKEIISSVLPRELWEEQYSVDVTDKKTSDSKRVQFDFYLRLNNPPGPIGIDAKFPVDKFQQVLTAEDGPEKQQLAREFRKNIEGKIKNIADKYIIPGTTSEFALMFVPSEAMFATIYQHFDYVNELARKNKVYVVSPSTLMASLNAIRAVVSTMEVQQNAQLIYDELLLVGEDARRLAERATKEVKQLSGLTKLMDQFETSATKIYKRIDKLKSPQSGLSDPRTSNGELEDTQKPPSP